MIALIMVAVNQSGWAMYMVAGDQLYTQELFDSGVFSPIRNTSRFSNIYYDSTTDTYWIQNLTGASVSYQVFVFAR